MIFYHLSLAQRGDSFDKSDKTFVCQVSIYIVYLEKSEACKHGEGREEKRKGKTKKERRTLRGPEVHEEPLKYVKWHSPLRLPLLPPPFPNFFFLLILNLRLSSPPSLRGSTNQDTEPAGVSDAHNRLQILFFMILSIHGTLRRDFDLSI